MDYAVKQYRNESRGAAAAAGVCVCLCNTLRAAGKQTGSSAADQDAGKLSDQQGAPA